jgi:hypothetical protein
MRVNAHNVFAIAVACAAGAAACTRDQAAVNRGSIATDSAVGAPAPKTGLSDYLGLRYETPPAGVRIREASMLPGANYSVSHVATPKGDMIWLDSLVTSPNGPRARVIRAAIPIAKPAKDERLFIASCDVNGRLDPTIVAIAVNDTGSSKFTRIRQAWRIDTRSAAFELIPVAGITCEAPGGA